MLFSLILTLVRGDPFFSRIISQSVANSHCTRYYHRSGGVGCRTATNGTLGVLLPYSAFVRVPSEL